MSKHESHKVVPMEGRAAFTTSKFSEGKRGELHPLILIANAKLPDPREPSRHLTLDSLTEWLAQKAGLPYLRIDPTKIDIARVGEVVAPSYATRYRILPVDISADALTIATSEPFDARWLPDLEPLLDGVRRHFAQRAQSPRRQRWRRHPRHAELRNAGRTRQIG